MMSAMSASPVKPVLPPTGVNVTPPVVTSPPKIGIPIPPTLTISPAKPANMNHVPMPMGMPDHKMPQFSTQPTTVAPAMQPMMPQRTPEKPKDLSAPVLLPMKPTSNGMEGMAFPNQSHMPSSTPTESQVMPSTAQATKAENQVAEMPDSNAVQTPPTPMNVNSAEPTVATAAPSTDPVAEPEKKNEPTAAKPAEPVNEPSVPPIPATQELTTLTPMATAAPVLPVAANTAPTPTPAATASSVPATVAPAAVPTSAAPTPIARPMPDQPVVTPSVSRTETSLTHSKSEIKVATIPRQATKRKRDSKVVPATPEVKKDGKDDDRKSKRVRLPTQPYQSPLPELNIIAKINKSTKSTPSKAPDDKLIVFYKNEFLAVRNAEGGFYVCQTMQNIYKSSPRIRIRWLSQEEGKDTYSPDFYDHTDFDCILTNLNLDKVEKEKFRLPQEEQQRTESILKRALDVEKGVSEKPPVTEEHPDGLDLSLFCDESQLKKSRGRSKKSGKKANSSKSDEADSDSEDEEDDDEDEEEDEEDEKKAKTESAPKTSKRKKKTAKKKAPPPTERRAAVKTVSTANKSSVTPAKKKTESRVGSKRKLSVPTTSQPVEKRARKSDSSSQSSERSNKTRSAEVAAAAKRGGRDRRSKSRK